MFKRFALLFITILTLQSFGIAQAQDVEATLEFRPSKTQLASNETFSVEIYLKNPGLKDIISVRAWLEYDPKVLEGVSISTDNTPFSLAAPGENEFSPEEGYVKIGRSNTEGGFSDAETKVATVQFKVKSTSKANAQLEPYDYQTTELGHTSVNIIEDGFPVNILSAKPESISLALNGASGQVQETMSVSSQTLGRPEQLKINTGSGYVDLKWLKTADMNVKGYNLYYGKTSGEYSRRRSIELADQYRLDGLNNGEVYYFALTAFDAQNKESDYSDEVAIIINEPKSSTSPFDEVSASILAEVPATPQNGPLIWLLGFSAMGLGGVMAFRKRKY